MNRHVEALAEEFLGRGHHVRVLAPLDPPGRLSRLSHRAAPEPREPPEYLTPLGRTVGIAANGAVSNLSVSPRGGVLAPRLELRGGDFDIVHIHEPIVPLVGWNAALGTSAPAVGTFHSYSTKALPNHIGSALGARRVFNRLSARIAVSEAAAWTGRRWYGGRYEIIPNGVDLTAAPDGPKPSSEELRVLFIGRAEERKGLPVLLSAFGALTEHVPCRLTVIGAEREEVRRYLADPETMRFIDVHGRVSGERLWAHLHDADLLCAPSLSGESFGMILTEAFAAGTPVIASEIAGYSDVVSDGVDGVLVPPADPQRLAEELQRAHHEPERLREMGVAARRSAQRYAWPHVADRVTEVYEQALEAPRPVTRAERFGHWAGYRPADGAPPVPAQRLPSLDPPLARSGSRRRRVARRVGPRRRRRARRRADDPRGPQNRRRQRRRKHRPLRLHLGADRLGADGPLALLPRRLVVLDRADRAAQPAGAPSRRHRGDDDRSADVGDPAGSSRRAGARPLALPPDRPDAGNVPGDRRDARLADAAQPRRAGRCSG